MSLRTPSAHHAIYTATLLALSTITALAWAEPSPALDRASLSVGAFYADPRINYVADTNYGHIDSGTYKADHVTLPRVKAQVLLGDTQGLDFDYYRYDKTYNPSLSGTTNRDGIPLTGNGKLDANLKLDLANMAYKWWLGSGNDVFGVGVGAAYYRARVDGTASGILNGVSGNAAYSESESAYAPLLELGWRHSFAPNLRMFVDASGIKKNGGNLTGHIYGGAVGVEWYPTPAIGVVAEYSATKISLSRERDAQDLNVRLNGPAAYIKFRF
ncbi:hypothetical protein ACEN9F_08840 [Duganella sp. CT11-25]|jgi:hypothetical protein|uniref:hypothetical protein n=1 Tax=unclassified Duganella TaxID=2636909 RepID=UPI0039AEF769